MTKQKTVTFLCVAITAAMVISLVISMASTSGAATASVTDATLNEPALLFARGKTPDAHDQSQRWSCYTKEDANRRFAGNYSFIRKGDRVYLVDPTRNTNLDVMEKSNSLFGQELRPGLKTFIAFRAVIVGGKRQLIVEESASTDYLQSSKRSPVSGYSPYAYSFCDPKTN